MVKLVAVLVDFYPGLQQVDQRRIDLGAQVILRVSAQLALPEQKLGQVRYGLVE